MLPTAWLYAQFPFYSMMNNQDVFVQWIADPHPMFSLRLDLHWLRLNSSPDFAYFGGGATKNDFFGYGRHQRQRPRRARLPRAHHAHVPPHCLPDLQRLYATPGAKGSSTRPSWGLAATTAYSRRCWRSDSAPPFILGHGARACVSFDTC